MPLVDYGSSDESDSEGSSGDQKEEVLQEDSRSKDQNDEVRHDQISFNESLKKTSLNEPELFANLPMPKSSFSLGEDSLKLLSKTKSQPVKILLPSLSDLQSGDNGEIKKKKPSPKGSGLFALLPAPKNVNSLIPKSINNKLNSACKTKPIPKKKEPPAALNPIISKHKFDDDDNDELDMNPSSFFFTSNNDDVLSKVDENESITSFEEKKSKISDMMHATITPDVEIVNSAVNISESGIPSYSEINHIHDNAMDVANLNDEAIEKLCGTRARKRKGALSEEVIDINVDSMVGDAYRWLSKDLTKEHEHRGFKKAKNLSVVERRKHQITYLASQAKEKEMELRNQWANSRMTRKQTQSKYGF